MIFGVIIGFVRDVFYKYCLWGNCIVDGMGMLIFFVFSIDICEWIWLFDDLYSVFIKLVGSLELDRLVWDVVVSICWIYVLNY